MHPSRPQVPAGSAGARNVCSEGLMQAMPLQGEGAPEARSERAEGLCGAQTGCLPEAFLPSALDPDFRASLLLTLPCCPSRVFRSRHWSPHRPPPLCPGGLATAACPSPEREGRSLGLWVTHLTYTLAPCNSCPGSRTPRAPTEQGHVQSCCLAWRCLGLGSGSQGSLPGCGGGGGGDACTRALKDGPEPFFLAKLRALRDPPRKRRCGTQLVAPLGTLAGSAPPRALALPSLLAQPP